MGARVHADSYDRPPFSCGPGTASDLGAPRHVRAGRGGSIGGVRGTGPPRRADSRAPGRNPVPPCARFAPFPEVGRRRPLPFRVVRRGAVGHPSGVGGPRALRGGFARRARRRGGRCHPRTQVGDRDDAVGYCPGTGGRQRGLLRAGRNPRGTGGNADHEKVLPSAGVRVGSGPGPANRSGHRGRRHVSDGSARRGGIPRAARRRADGR